MIMTPRKGFWPWQVTADRTSSAGAGVRKVALLAGGGDIHTIRWANAFADQGLEVQLITQHPLVEPVQSRVAVTEFPNRGNAGYFRMVPAVRRLLRDIQPDVLNAHYASGYATTARLTGFRPWLLSVWGSDVYRVPERSVAHRWWVRRNLAAADRVASTSHAMAERASAIAGGLEDIAVTPFGVDVELFSGGAEVSGGRGEQDPLVVGTVKSLAPVYGIDTLIRAFTTVRSRLMASAPTLAARLRLRIVGDGPDRKSLEALAGELDVGEVTEFVGRVPHQSVPAELGQLDIYAALSRSESFGVAVIEAGAARRPVVVSDAGGLPEVVEHGKTGLVVPREDPDAAADALERLIMDPELRHHMGEAGAAHVAEHYGWDASVARMVRVLEETRRAYLDASMRC